MLFVLPCLSNPHVTDPGRPLELGNVVRDISHASRPFSNRHEPLQPPQQPQHQSNRVNFDSKADNNFSFVSTHQQPSSESHNGSFTSRDTPRRQSPRLKTPQRFVDSLETLPIATSCCCFCTFSSTSPHLWATAQVRILRRPTHVQHQILLHNLVDAHALDEPLQLHVNAAAVFSGTTSHRAMKLSL